MINGKEFASIHKAISHNEDLIGYEIDNMLKGMNVNPKIKLKIHDYITKNRVKLSNLISLDIDTNIEDENNFN